VFAIIVAVRAHAVLCAELFAPETPAAISSAYEETPAVILSAHDIITICHLIIILSHYVILLWHISVGTALKRL
jgi:hypothetical protein